MKFYGGAGWVKDTKRYQPVQKKQVHKSGSFPDGVSVNTISEYTSGSGVTIDGVKLKDGGATVITGGSNTFNITNGTASIDVAAGKVIDINANITVSATATVSGTNTGDITLATDHGLGLTNQVLNMGTPSSITGTSTNSVTTTTHTHALDASSIGTIGGTTIDATTDITLKGTTGGLVRKFAEATSSALSGATGSIAVNVPVSTRILGIQLRVDTAVTFTEDGATWTAAYVNTPTTAICSGQNPAANTKFNAIHPAYELTTDTVTITLTPNDHEFAGGVIRAIVYYETFDAMASL